MPRRRVRQPTPVSLPGESNGQRSWAGYGPRCCRESDTTERLSTHIHTHTVCISGASYFSLIPHTRVSFWHENHGEAKKTMGLKLSQAMSHRTQNFQSPCGPGNPSTHGWLEL